MAKNSSKTKGLTLAELLVVIVILGVLGALAMPKLFPQKEKAVVAEAVGVLHAIRMGELSYRADTGSFVALSSASNNTAWNQIGIDNPASNKFTYAVDTVNEQVLATRTDGESVPEKYQSKKIVLFLQNGTWDETSSDHPLGPKN